MMARLMRHKAKLRLRSQWSDNGSARGEWLVGVTAEVNNPVLVAVSTVIWGRFDNWTATIFGISMEPVVVIEDPTTA